MPLDRGTRGRDLDPQRQRRVKQAEREGVRTTKGRAALAGDSDLNQVFRASDRAKWAAKDAEAYAKEGDQEKALIAAARYRQQMRNIALRIREYERKKTLDRFGEANLGLAAGNYVRETAPPPPRLSEFGSLIGLELDKGLLGKAAPSRPFPESAPILPRLNPAGGWDVQPTEAARAAGQAGPGLFSTVGSVLGAMFSEDMRAQPGEASLLGLSPQKAGEGLRDLAVGEAKHLAGYVTGDTSLWWLFADIPGYAFPAYGAARRTALAGRVAAQEGLRAGKTAWSAPPPVRTLRIGNQETTLTPSLAYWRADMQRQTDRFSNWLEGKRLKNPELAAQAGFLQGAAHRLATRYGSGGRLGKVEAKRARNLVNARLAWESEEVKRLRGMDRSLWMPKLNGDKRTLFWWLAQMPKPFRNAAGAEKIKSYLVRERDKLRDLINGDGFDPDHVWGRRVEFEGEGGTYVGQIIDFDPATNAVRVKWNAAPPEWLDETADDMPSFHLDDGSESMEEVLGHMRKEAVKTERRLNDQIFKITKGLKGFKGFDEDSLDAARALMTRREQNYLHAFQGSKDLPEEIAMRRWLVADEILGGSGNIHDVRLIPERAAIESNLQRFYPQGTAEEHQAFMSLMDARARAAASTRGITPHEWYAREAPKIRGGVKKLPKNALVDTGKYTPEQIAALEPIVAGAKVPDGGFTLNPDMTPFEASSGYTVAYGAFENRVPAAELTPEHVLNYAGRHEGSPIGGWHNPDNGDVYLDTVRQFDNQEEAMTWAREQGQLSAFDWGAAARGDMKNAFPSTGLSEEQANAIKAKLREQKLTDTLEEPPPLFQTEPLDEQVALADAERIIKMTKAQTGPGSNPRSTASRRIPGGLGTPEALASFMTKMHALAVEGEHAKTWYKDSAEAIMDFVNAERLTGDLVEDADRFASLLAVYSPRKNPEVNTNFAVGAWRQFQREGTVTVGTKVQQAKAFDILARGPRLFRVYSERKTGSFYLNMLRYIDEDRWLRAGGNDVVSTQDVWMRRVFNYYRPKTGRIIETRRGRRKIEQRDDPAPTDVQYTFMEDVTASVAAQMGWSADEVQAAVWTAFREQWLNHGGELKLFSDTPKEESFKSFLAKFTPEDRPPMELDEIMDIELTELIRQEEMRRQVKMLGELNKVEEELYLKKPPPSPTRREELMAEKKRLEDEIVRISHLTPGDADRLSTTTLKEISDLPEKNFRAESLREIGGEGEEIADLEQAISPGEFHVKMRRLAKLDDERTRIQNEIDFNPRLDRRKALDRRLKRVEREIRGIEEALKGARGALGADAGEVLADIRSLHDTSTANLKEAILNSPGDDFSPAAEAAIKAMAAHQAGDENAAMAIRDAIDLARREERHDLDRELVVLHELYYGPIPQFPREDALRLGYTLDEIDMLPETDELLQKSGGVIKGSYSVEDGQKIIRLFEGADFGTLVHELGHFLRSDLDPTDLAKFEQYMGVQGGTWARENEEAFAEAFVRYLTTGVAPRVELEGAFSRARGWLLALYKGVDGEGLHINDDLRQSFDLLFANADEPVYVGHRVNVNVAKRWMRSFNPHYTGRRPAGFGKRNELKAMLGGWARTDPDVILEDFFASEKYRAMADMRDVIFEMGVPLDLTGVRGIPEGFIVVNRGSGQMPTSYRRDIAALREGEGFYEETDPELFEGLLEYAQNSYIEDDAVFQQILDAISKDAKKYKDFRLVRKDMVRRVLGNALPADSGILGESVDLMNDLVKFSLIYASPGYIPGNLMGNIPMGFFQQGPWIVPNLVKAAGTMSHFQQNTRLINLIRSQVGYGFTRALANGGNVVSDMVKWQADKQARIADDWPRYASWIHEAGRFEMKTEEDFIELFRKALLDDKSARMMKAHGREYDARDVMHMLRDRVNLHMVDFERMTPFEKRYVTRVFFIWPWVRGATAYPFSFALEHPGRSAALGKVAGGESAVDMPDQFEGPKSMPFAYWVDDERVMNLSSVHPAGNAIESVKALFDAATSARKPENPLTDFLSPPIRLAGEALFGRDAPLKTMKEESVRLGPFYWLWGEPYDAGAYGPSDRWDVVRRKTTKGVWPEEVDRRRAIKLYTRDHDLSIDSKLTMKKMDAAIMMQDLGIPRVPEGFDEAFRYDEKLRAAQNADSRVQKARENDDDLGIAQAEAIVELDVWKEYVPDRADVALDELAEVIRDSENAEAIRDRMTGLRDSIHELGVPTRIRFGDDWIRWDTWYERLEDAYAEAVASG